MKRTKRILPLLWLLLIATTLNLFGCFAPKDEEPYDFDLPQTKSVDLMVSFASRQSSGKEADDTFRQNQLRLAAELFTASYEASEEKNVMISPLSIQLALAMTANGAVGQTKEEMETLLGGELSIDELNQYLKTYVDGLPSEEQYKLNVANAIWLRDCEEFIVNDTFLQKNADYYGAGAYQAPFDDSTLKEINAWVNEKTDGMIPKILNEIPRDAMMYLVNTVLFDAEWQKPYHENQEREGTFTSLDGEEQKATMLHSTESRYLSSENAVGFVKGFVGWKYTFAAILPNEGISLEDYLAAFDGEELSALLDSESDAIVYATMPKFSYDFSLLMNDVLKELGMPTAFDEDDADFSELGHHPVGLCISKVLHKARIEVGPLGTKAGAATVVQMDGGSAAPIDPKVVTLDRPFIYLILDNETDLPIFIGTLTSLE